MRASLNKIKITILSCSLLLIIVAFQTLRSQEKINSYVAKRINVMKAACKHHGLDTRGEDSLHQPYSWENLIAKEKDATLVWCNIFKSGSSR